MLCCLADVANSAFQAKPVSTVLRRLSFASTHQTTLPVQKRNFSDQASVMRIQCSIDNDDGSKTELDMLP
jgi:hypothetical protein